MMPAFEVGPPPPSIRKGLKQHPIRENHNHCQCCKVSKCSLADIARQTIGFTKACPLWVKSRHVQCTKPMSAKCQKRTSVAIHRRSLGLLVKALTVLCHARSIDRKLCSLPHVEEIFCSLVVTRVNSCRPDRADLLRSRQRGKQKRREGEHRKTFLHGGSAFRKRT